MPQFSVLPGDGAAPSALVTRSDVTVRKGLYTLVNDHLTPDQASARDLLAVRRALDAAGLEFLLVRGNRGRLVLAVDAARRRELAEAFARAFDAEPFYAKPVDAGSGPRLLSAGDLGGEPSARILRLYRPRVEPAGGLRYGAANGVQLELWDFGHDEIVAPQENALMRRTLPRDEAIDDSVEMHGLSWPTLHNMFTRHASDVDFDIDIVFSWVDGSDAAFQRARAQRMQSYVVGEGDAHAARFRQVDELRYALRSVYLFAPWIRNIFIATDSPAPAWLADHPRVRIVRSEEFFADTTVLPTHNSHAVEAQLHHIEGLSEHFLYSNDDMFFGRHVRPEMFFSPGGVTKFIEAGTRIGLGESAPTRSGHENAARVNRRLLHERFGRVTTRHLEHTATPLRRSVLHEMEREFAEDFRRTAANAFRAADDISVTNSFYHYYALMTGRAVTQTEARVKYVDTTVHEGLRAMDRLLAKRSMDFFCLNDGSFPEVPEEVRATSVREFLEAYFPIPAPWENVDAAAALSARQAEGGRA